jgi:tripartite-type tricarboxylate transporter receptor subunit TctC
MFKALCGHWDRKTAMSSGPNSLGSGETTVAVIPLPLGMGDIRCRDAFLVYRSSLYSDGCAVTATSLLTAGTMHSHPCRRSLLPPRRSRMPARPASSAVASRFFSRWLRLGALILATATLPIATSAQPQTTYPTRPVSLVVAFPAGSGADVIARIVAKGLETAANQPFIVVNRPGATGAIAADSVKHAAPDGYTLLIGTNATMAAYWALKTNPAFDTLKDFVAVTPMASTYYLLLVNPAVPATTVARFVDYLKVNPDKLNYGSGGVGGTSHLLGEWFKQVTGTNMRHIPYQGTGPATQATVAGEVQATFDQLIAMSFVRQGQLRALGITSPTASPFAPGVAPIAQTLPGFEASSWLGLFAPAGTPDAIVAQLRSYWAAASRQPEVLTALQRAANTPMRMPQDEFVRLIKAEAERWGRIGRAAKIFIE